MDSHALVAQLHQFGLWPASDAAQADICRLEQQLSDARALSKELLARNLLTPYQANQLLNGKGQSLVVGPYRIDERLGEGASAQIFKAHHFRLGRVVALKIIRPQLVQNNPVAVERFIREAQAAAALSHPNVVRAYDVGQAGEVYFFAMQFIDGHDLSRLVQKEGRLELDRACDYIAQAGRGLQSIHDNGMVHRDIKPSNLMVELRSTDNDTQNQQATLSVDQTVFRSSPFGLVRILDLGLARLNEDISAPSQQAALTRVGTVMGTPDYMAPEQALHSRNADIRSDIYSLGCTLYFLLTAQPPFPGGDAIEKMLKHQLDDPRPVEDLRPDVPVQVRSILSKMMAKKKDDRYQLPRDVVRALEIVLEPPARAIPVVPSPSSAPEVPPSPVVEAPAPPAAPVAPYSVAEETVGSDLSELPPLVPSPLVRVPTRQSDWGLWVLLTCACVGAIVCLIVALLIVLR